MNAKNIKYNNIINRNISLEKISLGIEKGKYPFLNLHLFLKKLNNDYFMGCGSRISEIYILLSYNHVELNEYPTKLTGNLTDVFSFMRDSYFKILKYKGLSKYSTVKKYISNISLCILPYKKANPTDILLKYKAFLMYKLNECKLKLIGKNFFKDEILKLPSMQEYSKHIQNIISYNIVTEKGIIIDESSFKNEFDIKLKENFLDIFKHIKTQVFSIIPENNLDYKENNNKIWVKFCISESFLNSFMPNFTKEELDKNFLYVLSSKKNNNTDFENEEYYEKLSK